MKGVIIMRIGWHVPLPGPISVGGTVYRSKRGGGSGCAIFFVVAMAIGGMSMLSSATHGLVWPILGLVAVAGVIGLVWRRRRVMAQAKSKLAAGHAAMAQAKSDLAAMSDAEVADLRSRLSDPVALSWVEQEQSRRLRAQPGQAG